HPAFGDSAQVEARPRPNTSLTPSDFEHLWNRGRWADSVQGGDRWAFDQGTRVADRELRWQHRGVEQTGAHRVRLQCRAEHSFHLFADLDPFACAGVEAGELAVE